MEEKELKGKCVDLATEIPGSRAIDRRATVIGEKYNPKDDELNESKNDDIEIIPKTDEEKKRILSQCGKFFLLSMLDKASLNVLINAMVRKPMEKGEVIDDGDFFYLIDSGKFKVYTITYDKTKTVETYKPYDNEGLFGEWALHNQPRKTTVKAASEGLLWAVNCRTYEDLVVKMYNKSRSYVGLLDRVPQLKALSEYEKRLVAYNLSERSYTPSEVIVQEGDDEDGIYFIVEGKVSVREKKASHNGVKDIEIQQLEKGAFFGEMVLIKRQPRSAAVVAIEDTKIAFMDVNDFECHLMCMDIMKRHTESF